MKAIGQISILHLILLSMTCIGLKNHVTILPSLLEHVKRDGWMSVLLSMIILLPWLYIIVYIQKQTESQPINIWMKEKVGSVLTNIILYSTVIIIFLLAAFTMRETILWISATFLNYTPQILLLIIYIFVCFLLASTNIQTIVITNAFVLFFITLFGYYVALANLKVKDYSLLLPMFENGVSPILKGAVYPASGFIELILLTFLHHHLKKQLKWRHLVIIILILAGLTLGPLTGAVAEFGPIEASKQKYPAYEEWGLVTLGEFIDHMDFLSIHQWLSGTFIRVGTLMFIVADILSISGKPKKIWLWLMPPFLFLNLILYVMDDTLFLELNNHGFLVVTVIFFFILSITLLLTVLKGKKKNNMNQESVTNNGPKEGSINITINQSFSGKSNESANQQTNGQPNSSYQSNGGQPNNYTGSQFSNEPTNQQGGGQTGSFNQSNGEQPNNNATKQSNEQPINITINQSAIESSEPNTRSNEQSNNGQPNESLNISIDQSTNANDGSGIESRQRSDISANQPENKPNNESSNQSNNGSDNKSSGNTINQPADKPINISINLSTNESNQSTDNANNKSAGNQSGQSDESAGNSKNG